ncbi:hypothetical protein COO16_04095 [Bacillus pseudomycoides]|uniref:hypothetical protein n=1 Tax=Bacillus pseudomycoides TaxID=64104 RepID=UPI000BEB3B92|nr:hypothetical protein [Bacillus pseudomycoides]PDY14150.1 hypothetical protein COO16_04095 [Bacillus pseudomycoides]
MRKATQLIIKEFPVLEQHLHSHEDTLLRQKALDSLESEVEKTFLILAWFFEDPQKNDFDVRKLYNYLQDDWLEFSLDILNTFFKHDTYLINKPTHSVILDRDDYFSQTSFANFLNEKGFKFDQRKISVYRKRGSIPKEDIVIAGIPYWSKFTVEEYAKSLKT